MAVHAEIKMPNIKSLLFKFERRILYASNVFTQHIYCLLENNLFNPPMSIVLLLSIHAVEKKILQELKNIQLCKDIYSVVKRLIFRHLFQNFTQVNINE